MNNGCDRKEHEEYRIYEPLVVTVSLSDHVLTGHGEFPHFYDRPAGTTGVAHRRPADDIAILYSRAVIA
jgi:hypothetical protein